MPVLQLPQPPQKTDPRFDDWVKDLHRRVTLRDRIDDIEAAITSASSGINTTETIVVGGLGNSKIVANTLRAGSTFRARLFGTCTATAARTSTFRVRCGTAGTTADTAIGSATTAVSATTGTSIAFDAEIVFSVRTVGSAGTIYGWLLLNNQGTTGIATSSPQVIALTAAAVNTTVDNWLSITYQSATTSAVTSTFQNAIIEVVKD